MKMIYATERHEQVYQHMDRTRRLLPQRRNKQISNSERSKCVCWYRMIFVRLGVSMTGRMRRELSIAQAQIALEHRWVANRRKARSWR